MTGPDLAVRCLACDGSLDARSAFRGVDRLLGTPGEFEVRTCAVCGTGVTLPPATPAELSRFYPDTYGPYDDALGPVAGIVSRAIRSWQGRIALARQPLRALGAVTPGRVLDVGCGRGDLGAQLRSGGWQVVGVEPSKSACLAARGRGIEARHGTLADVELEGDSYDAVVFQHSLEHTSDPIRDLGRVTAVLRPGGLVLISVPNYACWQRRRFRGCWYHADLPRHRVHFTPRGLRSAREGVGLHVEALTTSTTAVGLPATIQYAIAGRCLFPGGLKLRLATGLCALALPVNWLLDRLHGGGDQLHAVARLEADVIVAPIDVKLGA